MLFVTPIGRVIALLAGIQGTVRSAGEARLVVGVHVEVDGAERAVTDSIGGYTIGGLAVGAHQLRFIARGYETRQVSVMLADSAQLTLDVEVTPRPVMLAPITVVAQASTDPRGTRPVFATDWEEAGHYRFAPDWQANQPAGSVDVQQALARAPGVATRGDNVNALSVHGARGSENRVLLDGIPLYGAVHFAGASSAINPDAVAMMDLHTGVSSARFGGALSGVVELETAETSRGAQLSGDLSTADVRSMVRTELGTTGSVLLGARSSIRNLMTDAAGLGVVNGYQDFVAVGRTTIGNGVLRVVGFENTNRLRWEPVVAGSAALLAPGTQPVSLTASDAASWESNALGATWTQLIGPDRAWHAAGWWSGTTTTIATLAPDRTERLSSGIGEFGLSTELRQGFGNSALIVGGELTRTRTSYRTTTSFPHAGASLTGVDLATAPLLGAAYGEWDWHGGSRLDFRAGLRGNVDFQRSVSLDPRLVVNFRADPFTRIELAFGTTHQAIQSLLNEDNLMSAVIGPSLLANTSDARPVASSNEWVMSVERQLAPGVTLAVDGYARNWRNVLAPAATTTGFFVATAPTFGDGAARGVNASVAIATGSLTAQASAGLAMSVQRANGVSYPSSFDQPWTFSGDVSYRLPARTTFQARWNMGAGQPATAVLSNIAWSTYQPATGIGEIEGSATNLAGAINGLRLAGPLRIDLGLRREWNVGRGGSMGGFTTAVRLENLFNGANPVGVIAGAGGLQLLPGTGRGVVFEVGWAH